MFSILAETILPWAASKKLILSSDLPGLYLILRKSQYKIPWKICVCVFVALTYLFSDSSLLVNIFSIYTLNEVFSFSSIQEGGCTSVETDTMASE